MWHYKTKIDFLNSGFKLDQKFRFIEQNKCTLNKMNFTYHNLHKIDSIVDAITKELPHES